MKTTINIIIVSALMAVATSATAKSWRINNNAAAAPNFASINAAMSSADVLAGDTLYLDPGTSLSGVQTVNKQVTIVGPGYFRSDTPHAFAYLQDALTIKAAETKVEGIIMSNADIYIAAQHVTIERCKMRAVRVGRDLDWNGYDARYAVIRQSYGNNVYGVGNTDNRSAYCTIENCILMNGDYIFDDLYLPYIRNNYLKGTSASIFDDISNATITNNVIINVSNPNSTISNYVINSVNISHNVISGNANANYPYNKYGYNTEADIFTLTGMNDQRYQLKVGSPAIGYASEENGGGDCGPYGGLTPYVPGGLPNGYPYYTKAIIPAKSKNGKVNVSLKIKMQND